MCGICGYIGNNKSFNPDLLRIMNSTITRRGPDDDGYYYGDAIGLAMRRLSILGLASGKQPIFNDKNNICVVYNGEIYNFKKLRDELSEYGYVFRTDTDTEVIVYLYEHYGDDFVNHLRGMFAFALHDLRTSRTILARDRLGIKPIYYTELDGSILFGSELKCLIASGMIEKKVDLQSIDAFLTLNYIPAPNTIYQNVFKLEPGCMLVHENNSYVIKRYWDIDFESKLDHDVNTWRDLLEDKIRESTVEHLVSDVPVGAFLSGGVDSGLVVAFMSEELGENISTFTMGFTGQQQQIINEMPYARQVSNLYSTVNNEYHVEPDFGKIINHILDSFDEPFSDDSVIPSYYISELASKKVKVALSGLGGDELFGGYHRYTGFKLSLLYQNIPKFIHRNFIKPVINGLKEPQSGSDGINHAKRFVNSSDMKLSSRYFSYLSSINDHEKEQLYTTHMANSVKYQLTEQMITRHFDNCKSSDPMDKVFYTDLKTYLPDDILTLSDRLSMYHSLELRVPFVDHELVELTAKIPSHYKVKLLTKKYLLKKIARKYLPENVISHRKQGFESPMALWLKTDLKEFCKETLNEDVIAKQGLFNYSYIQKKMNKHFNNEEKNNKLLFSLIILTLWLNRENITLQ